MRGFDRVLARQIGQENSESTFGRTLAPFYMGPIEGLNYYTCAKDCWKRDDSHQYS
jgi:hypothetical protein